MNRIPRKLIRIVAHAVTLSRDAGKALDLMPVEDQDIASRTVLREPAGPGTQSRSQRHFLPTLGAETDVAFDKLPKDYLLVAEEFGAVVQFLADEC